MGDVHCVHDWVPSEGHRGKYWCQRCDATGWRSQKQWAGKIHAHALSHPEYRPELTVTVQHINRHRLVDGVYSTDGRIAPKPRAK